MMIGDIIVNNSVEFANLKDKFFKFTHWNEPVNYRRKGLGSYLLKSIINLAKEKNIYNIYGSLVQQDLDKNPNLIHWYKKYGFRIVPPTAKEVYMAKHKICLYLD